MQVKKLAISDTRVKLSIVADQATLDTIKNQVLKHLAAQHVKLPGFRAGKAPLALVEKHVDPSLLQSEFLEEAVNRMYSQAIRAEKIIPVEQPKINLKKFVPFTTLEVDAEVEAIFDIKLGNYKVIKMQPKTVKITAKDIDGVIGSLKHRLAERIPVIRTAKKGDEITMDFKGTDSKGQPVTGADGTDYPIVLGSNTFIPGFEPNLVGLKSGQEKNFTVTFPKDYGVAALQSKKVTFHVVAKQVQEVVEPKVDDAFAAKAGPFKTLSELKDDIKKELVVEQQKQVDRDFENALIGEIVKKSSVNVPGVLINEEVERAEQAERQNLAYRGQTWEEHLKEEGISEEEHRQRNRPEAESKVKAGLVLSEIASIEDVRVSADELSVKIQLLRGQYKDKAMQVELDKPENKQEIENRLLTEKTVVKLREYATS